MTDVLSLTTWSGWGLAPEMWAVLLRAVAVLIALAMAVTRRDAAYILVLTWAFAGIGVKQAAAPLVANAGWAAAATTALFAVWALWPARRRTA